MHLISPQTRKGRTSGCCSLSSHEWHCFIQRGSWTHSSSLKSLCQFLEENSQVTLPASRDPEWKTGRREHQSCVALSLSGIPPTAPHSVGLGYLYSVSLLKYIFTFGKLPWAFQSTFSRSDVQNKSSLFQAIMPFSVKCKDFTEWKFIKSRLWHLLWWQFLSTWQNLESRGGQISGLLWGVASIALAWEDVPTVGSTISQLRSWASKWREGSCTWSLFFHFPTAQTCVITQKLD